VEAEDAAVKYREIDARQLAEGYVVLVNGSTMRRDYRIVQWLDDHRYTVAEPIEAEDYEP
jgi:hypothetical protein